MAERIKIDINNETGEMNIETSGFRGNVCEQTIDAVLDGLETKHISTKRKDEYRYGQEHNSTTNVSN